MRRALERIRASADRRRHRQDQHGVIFVKVVAGAPFPPRRPQLVVVPFVGASLTQGSARAAAVCTFDRALSPDEAQAVLQDMRARLEPSPTRWQRFLNRVRSAWASLAKEPERCGHTTDGTMCEECAIWWAIK